MPPANVNDVIAVTAFIGSIFGAGGGGEATNSELLAKLQRRPGPDARPPGVGRRRCSPTTPRRRPRSASASTTGRCTGGKVRGSVIIDPGSIAGVRPAPGASGAGRRGRERRRPPPAAAQQASNFQVVVAQRSATGNTLAVMGPQLGYYYPEIVQQIAPAGPGHQRPGRGRARPGDVHPDRAHPELRLEPHLGRPRRPRRVRRAALQPGRLAAHAGLQRTTATRASAARSTNFNAGLLDGKALKLQGLGARPGDRHGHGRTASRTRSPASARRSGATA